MSASAAGRANGPASPCDASSYLFLSPRHLRFEPEAAAHPVPRGGAVASRRSAVGVGVLGEGQASRTSAPAAAAFRAHLRGWPRGRRPVLRHQRGPVLGVPRLQRDRGECSLGRARPGRRGCWGPPTVPSGRVTPLVQTAPGLPLSVVCWHHGGPFRPWVRTGPASPDPRSPALLCWRWAWGGTGSG